MRYFLTKALILKKQTSGENDWFLTLFSPEFGKIQALSRSSRKILSQKGSHMDPLNLCDFQLYKNNDRYLVTDCKVTKPFLGIKSDLQKSILGFTIIELLLKTIQEDEDNYELFKLTLNALCRLDTTDNDLNIEEFKIKLLKLAGSWPEISVCNRCQTRWNQTNDISCDKHGNLFCENCKTSEDCEHHSINFNTLKLANYLSKENQKHCNILLSKKDLFNLKRFTAIFMGNYLHQELKSENIILG